MFNERKVSTTSNNTEQKEFVPVIPEDGLNAVAVSLLVYLGKHRKQPKFAKDSKGVVELNEDGSKKILIPKEGDKGLERKIAAYVDLLDQTHDYGNDIGVKNIRLPLHKVGYAISEGLNYVEVAPRDTQGNYIKGKPWTLAPASMWAKLAAVTKTKDGQLVKDVIFAADFNNPNLNNVGLLLGKPFMMNVEVKESVGKSDGKTYHNVSLKSPVPLMKGMNPPAPLVPPKAISFTDTDLLEPKEELGGSCKFDLIRQADLRKIVLAEDYAGSEMQKAIQQRMDEAALIEKAKELSAKAIAGNKELQEIFTLLGEDGVEDVAPPVVKKEVQQKVATPLADLESDIPFAPLGLQNKMSIHWM